VDDVFTVVTALNGTDSKWLWTWSVGRYLSKHVLEENEKSAIITSHNIPLFGRNSNRIPYALRYSFANASGDNEEEPPCSMTLVLLTV